MFIEKEEKHKHSIEYKDKMFFFEQNKQKCYIGQKKKKKNTCQVKSIF